MTSFAPSQYWENRLSRNFDLQGVGYIDMGRGYNRWLYRLKRAVFLKTMRNCGLELPRAEVLDIGAGTGFILDCWRELGASRLSATDLTAVAVENLRQRYPGCNVHQMDIGDESLSAEDGRYDAISCMDVLYHIVDDERHRRAINNIHSLLKPGGWFVFSNHFIRQAETRRAPACVSRPLHEEESVLHEAGFQIVLRRPMYVLMNTPVDSENALLTSYWKGLHAVVSTTRGAGRVLGGLLYPIERVLVSLCRESPSMEIMLCRKFR